MDATQIGIAINGIVQQWLDGVISIREMKKRINNTIALYDDRI